MLFKQNAVLQGLMPAFDLALGLRMTWTWSQPEASKARSKVSVRSCVRMLPAEHLPTRASIGVAELGENVLIEIVVTALR